MAFVYICLIQFWIYPPCLFNHLDVLQMLKLSFNSKLCVLNSERVSLTIVVLIINEFCLTVEQHHNLYIFTKFNPTLHKLISFNKMRKVVELWINEGLLWKGGGGRVEYRHVTTHTHVHTYIYVFVRVFTENLYIHSISPVGC